MINSNAKNFKSTWEEWFEDFGLDAQLCIAEDDTHSPNWHISKSGDGSLHVHYCHFIVAMCD